MKVELKDYKNIVDNLHEGIFILDKNFNIVFTNDFFSNLIDYKSNLLINKSFIKLLDIKQAELFGNHIESSIKKPLDLKIISKKNKIKYVRLSFDKYSTKKKQYIPSIVEDITHVHHEEVKKSCIYRISEAIHDTEDLDSLYIEIHEILSDITNVTNFYIALADWKLNTISFPYFVDEKDKKPKPYKMKKGLTEYVMNSGESLLLNHEIYKNLLETNNIEPIGSSCYNWLGVPLKLLNGKTIGMIGVQNYTNDYIFREEDMKLLQFVWRLKEKLMISKYINKHITMN